MSTYSKPVHSTSSNSIKTVDLAKISGMTFSRYCVGCIVLTKDRKIALQQRDDNCATYPGCLATFGGGIESGETPIQALVRELKEELGAEVNPEDVVNLGAITEINTSSSELIYVYFWHDKNATITGCYEGSAKYFDNEKQVMEDPKVMNDVCWLLKECKNRGLFEVTE